MGVVFKNQKWYWYALFVLVIFGLFLRLHDLGQESFWTDEIISLTHAEMTNIKDILWDVAVIELTPPGYFLILHYWISLFGNSEFSVRFLSAFFDTFSIILVYILGKELFKKKGKDIGLFAAFFFSTTMLQVVYSQEARNYSLFIFFMLLSTIYFIKYYVHNEKENKKLFAYVITLLIAFYLNYMTIFIILAQFTYVLLKKKKIRVFILSMGTIFIFYIPSIQIILIQLKILHPGIQRGLTEWGIPLFFASFGSVFFLLPILLIIFSLIIIYFILKLKTIKKLGDLTKRKIILGTLIGFFLILIFIHTFYFQTVSRSFSLIRHILFIAPLLYIFISRGILYINNTKQRNKMKKNIFLFLILIMVFNVVTLSYYYAQTTKAPWREATTFIESNFHSQPILLSRSGSNVDLVKYYVGDDVKIINLSWRRHRWSSKRFYLNKEQIKEKLIGESGFWLIVSRDVITNDVYKEVLKNNYVLDIKKEYKELELYHYSQVNFK